MRTIQLSYSDACGIIDIARYQSVAYAIMFIKKMWVTTDSLNPIRDILNRMITDNRHGLDYYTNLLVDYTRKCEVLAELDRNIDMPDAERCLNVICRANELGKRNERLLLAENNNAIALLKKLGIEPSEDIIDNLFKLQTAHQDEMIGEYDENEYNDIMCDVFYGAFCDFIGLTPDVVYDVDWDFDDTPNEGDIPYLDETGFSWSINIYRGGDVYYMAKDGTLTKDSSKSLPWCQDGFYICDTIVDSFGKIILFKATKY